MKQHNENNKISECIQEHKLHKCWRRLTVVLAALVTAVTISLLILPAITLIGDGIDFEPHITDISIEKDAGGTWTPAEELANGDSIRVTIHYTIPEGIVTQESKTIYYQLPSGVGLNEVEEGYVKINSDETVGTYTIETDGRVTILFDDAFADGRAFTGDLSFQGMVTATGESGDDEIDFGAAGGIITVVPKEKETGLSITKNGWYEKEHGAIGYTITVSSEQGSDGPITLTDAFLNEHIGYDMDMQAYPFKITGIDGQEITGYQIAIQEGSPASFTVTGLPALKAGESYTITYAAVPDLSSADANGYLQFTNKAVAKDNTNTVEAQANTVVSRTMIVKEGSYNPVTRKIKWTIYLNEDMRNIRGYTLRDTVICQDASGKTYEVSMPDTVTVTPYVGEQPAGESQQLSLPYTFPEDLAAPYDTCRYLVTYETELPADAPAGTALKFTNHAYFGDYSTVIEIPVDMPGELTYDVIKALAGTANHGRTANWTSMISYPQNTAVDLASLTYIDWVVDVIREDGSFISGSHYTTGELLANAVLTSADGSIQLVPGQDYTIYAAPHHVMDSFKNIGTAYRFLDMPLEDIDSAVGADWYTLDQIYTMGKGKEPIALIKIVFTQSALNKLNGQSILIQYQTSVDTSKLPLNTQLTLSNLARIPGDYYVASINHTFRERLNKQASPDGVEEGSHDTSSYTDDPLTLNSGEIGNILHYRILISDYSEYSSTGALTVTDTLPAGAELVKDSVILRRHPNGGDSFTDTTSDSWYLQNVATQKNEDGTTTVTFTIGHINDFNNDQFGIYYDVSIANDPALENNGTATYTNTAAWDGETDGTTTTVRHTLPLLEKTGEQLTDETGAVTDVVRYFVTVNPEGRDLDAKDDSIVLTDTLTVPEASAAAFRPNSVKLYRYDPSKENNCGAAMPSGSYIVQYDDNTRTITFTLPDSTPCVVVYEYTIDQGNAVGDIQISNTVKLSGRAGSSSESDIIIEEQTSQAGVNKATLTIYKHDALNVDILLPGAHFKLERYERQGDGSYVWETTALTAQGEDGTFVVGENGYIELSFIEHAEDGSLYNTLYRITEVTPPAGYEASAESYYFVWMEQGTEAAGTIQTMQEVWEAAGVEPGKVKFIAYSTNDSLYVPNTPTALSVEKIWLDENGEALENPPERIMVTLYQIKQDGSRTAYETVELNKANGWSYTWSDLPRTDGSGGEYLYMAEEDPLSGYAITYSINNTAGVQTGVITITNTKQDVYILPETGGIGPLLFTIAGVLLIGASGIGYGYLRHRQRKEEDAPR